MLKYSYLLHWICDNQRFKIEIPTMTIVVRAVFHENNKYHP